MGGVRPLSYEEWSASKDGQVLDYEAWKAANPPKADATRLPTMRSDRFQPPPQPGPRQGLLARSVNAIGAMADNPVSAAAGIVAAPVHTLKTVGDFFGQTAAELRLSDIERAFALADPERVSEREALFGAGQVAALALPFTRARSLLTPANKVARTGSQIGYGTAAGAAFSPDDPAVGAFLGGAGIALPKAVAGGYARSAAGKAQAARVAETAARRQRMALGETVTGQPRRVPASEVTPERLDRISYRPDPLAEHVVKPGAPRAPVASESYPLGTVAEGSGPMFQLKRTAFATGQATRRPKAVEPPAPEPIPEPVVEAPAGPPKVEPQGSPRVSAEWQAAYDAATPRQQAEMLSVRFRPNNAAEPIVLSPEEFARAQELIAKRPSQPVAEPPASLESFSAGRDPKEAPRVPPASELPPLIRKAQGKTGPGQYLDAATVEAIERELTNRGKDPVEVFARQGRMVEGPETPLDTPTKKLTDEGYPAEWDAIDPVRQPREFLNFAKFGLDQATEARLRSTVDTLREQGLEKGVKTFAEQRQEASAFAKKLVQDPLSLDLSKMSKLSGAEIVGLRQVAAENTKLIEGVSQAIESGTLSASEMQAASALIDRATASTNEVLSKIVKETAQTARDLGFLRQVAHLTTNPDAWIVRAKKMLGDKPLSDGMMVEIRKLAKAAAEACGGA